MTATPKNAERPADRMPPKRRRIAYALLAVFPLGLHRQYLGDRRGAWAYRNCALMAGIAWWLQRPAAFWVLLALLAAFAAYDIGWIARRLAAAGAADAAEAGRR